MRRGTILAVLTLLLVLVPTTPAYAWFYSFWGYDPVTGQHAFCQSKPDGVESPHPLRWWPPVGYTTVNTWYKLGTSLDATFKTAVRDAESQWETDVWEAGTKYFWWWEDTTPITDSTNRTLGMTVLPDQVLGQTFFADNESWHPWEYSARVNRNVHSFKRWYIRFQSDMTRVLALDGSGNHLNWGSTNSAYIADRQSVAAHEFGHTMVLGHPDELRNTNANTWQTMYGGALYLDRTGTYQRSPATDDEFAVEKLYPSAL